MLLRFSQQALDRDLRGFVLSNLQCEADEIHTVVISRTSREPLVESLPGWALEPLAGAGVCPPAPLPVPGLLHGAGERQENPSVPYHPSWEGSLCAAGLACIS